MDFSNISDIVRLIGGLGSVGTGVASAFRGTPMPYGVSEAANATNAANTYANASLDPSSPYFQPLAETENLRQRRDLISAVNEIIRQNASRVAGGQGTINPERRDETIWGVLARGFQEAGIRARETARQQLLNMAGTQRGIAQNYGALAQYGMQNQLLNRASQAAGTQGGFAATNAIADLFKPKGTGNSPWGAPSTPAPQQGTPAFGTSSVPNWWSDSTFGAQY